MDESSRIPRRKLDAIKELDPNPISELLDDILSEHPKPGKAPDSIYAQSRLAVLDEPVPRPAGKSSVGSVHTETQPDYPYVVALLPAQSQRVIEGACRLQWIVQVYRGGQWRNKYFCRTKAGLLLYAGRTAPDVAPPPPPSELLALPDRFPDAANTDPTGLGPNMRS
jgi:hypothetical protein